MVDHREVTNVTKGKGRSKKQQQIESTVDKFVVIHQFFQVPDLFGDDVTIAAVTLLPELGSSIDNNNDDNVTSQSVDYVCKLNATRANEIGSRADPDEVVYMNVLLLCRNVVRFRCANKFDHIDWCMFLVDERSGVQGNFRRKVVRVSIAIQTPDVTKKLATTRRTPKRKNEETAGGNAITPPKRQKRVNDSPVQDIVHVTPLRSTLNSSHAQSSIAPEFNAVPVPIGCTIFGNPSTCFDDGDNSKVINRYHPKQFKMVNLGVIQVPLPKYVCQWKPFAVHQNSS